MSDVHERIVAVQIERDGKVIGSLINAFDGSWLATWNTPTPANPYATAQKYCADYDDALALIVTADDERRRATPQ